MNQWVRKLSLIVATILSVALTLSCVGRSYLMVDYTVPAATGQLEGQVIRVQVVDERQDASVLTPAAASQFRDFGNRYSLAFRLPDDQRILAGEHDLTSVLREAFKKRLVQMGASVTFRTGADIPMLTIALTRLTIDLKDRKWIVDIGYEASLSKNDRLVMKENVRGSAERLRVVGRKGADTALSEIFTDITNRLDLVKMFKTAELIQ
jgi:hypothetical protein